MKTAGVVFCCRGGFLLRLPAYRPRPQWKQNHSTQVEAMSATQARHGERAAVTTWKLRFWKYERGGFGASM